MSLRPILLHPDPRLKKVADPVGEIDDEVRRLADDMLETMYDAPGVGLAAPQVGVSKRLLVMDCVKEEGAPPRPMVLIDPEIVWTSARRASTRRAACRSPNNTPMSSGRRRSRCAGGGSTVRSNPNGSTVSGRPACSTRSTTSTASSSSTTLTALKRQLITRKAVKRKRELARAS